MSATGVRKMDYGKFWLGLTLRRAHTFPRGNIFRWCQKKPSYQTRLSCRLSWNGGAFWSLRIWHASWSGFLYWTGAPAITQHLCRQLRWSFVSSNAPNFQYLSVSLKTKHPHRPEGERFAPERSRDPRLSMANHVLDLIVRCVPAATCVDACTRRHTSVPTLSNHVVLIRCLNISQTQKNDKNPHDCDCALWYRYSQQKWSRVYTWIHIYINIYTHLHLLQMGKPDNMYMNPWAKERVCVSQAGLNKQEL